MSRYKLSDILKNKNPGDEWYTLEAPEEVRIWQMEHPWEANFFRERRVSPLSISVRSREKSSTNTQKFTEKVPMKMKCGIDVTGRLVTKQIKSFHGKARVDSCVEINEFLKELSEKTGLSFWETFNLRIYNPKHAVEIEFKILNPDGHGAGLFLNRIYKGKMSKLYPEIYLSDQQLYVADFYSNLSHCTAVKHQTVGHGCAIEKKIKKKQIVKKKNVKRKVAV